MSLVDADKVQSISIFATVLWTLWSFNRLFSYVYPVYLFTFIDYLVRCSCFLIVLVYSCTWFVMTLSVYCKPNNMVMMFAAALLVHFDMSFQH